MTATEAELSPSEAAAFETKCRAFLDQYATGIDVGDDPRSEKELAANKAFQQHLADAGLAGITYDKSYGGAGLTRAHERIWRSVYSEYPAMTDQLTISHGMCVPMLAEYGSEVQKKEYLPDAIAARTVWCQMFSEPGAGSDVASLQSKAVLDGDEWTLNGQKVWTTLAHVCDYGIIIARTDPSVPKHQGISMFILPMDAPGVEIRAIHQIDGGKHFNEIFLTDVRLPKGNLIGEINGGWGLAISMLMYERVAIGTGMVSGIKTPNTKWLTKLAQAHGTNTNPVTRQKIMKIYSEEATKSLVAMRTRAELKAGRAPGPGGSLGKLHGAKIARMMRDTTFGVVGTAAAAWQPGDEDGAAPQQSVVRSFAANIAGGTDEIQKNIIGDRVLGLPREPSVDKTLPFNELKVGTQK